MTTQVTCPACSTTMRAKPELAGKRVKCPKCQATISVPGTGPDQEDTDQDGSPAVPLWLVLSASVLIAVAVGGAGGFVFGHREGKSDDVRELTEAKGQTEQAAARAEAAAQRQKTLETDLAAASAEQARERGRLEAVIKERDQQLIAANQATFQTKAQAKAAEDRLAAVVTKAQRDAEDKKQAEAEKKRIPAAPLTDERRRKSEADAEYVNRKLQSTNRSILKGMTILFGFNSLCEDDNVTKESIARVVGDDRDLLFTAGQMLVDVGSYIPPKSKKGLTLKESWDICLEALGVPK